MKKSRVSRKIFSDINALMIDNYDSFTYNVVQYFAMLGVSINTVRNDEVPLDKLSNYDFVIISPGPSTPNEAGLSLKAVEICHDEGIPLLGVCLGHQCIGQFFGGKVVPFTPPQHGKVSDIEHNSEGIYTGLASPIKATRYHSLVVEHDSLPEVLTVTSTSADGVIQSFRHKEKPLVGVQYHPESILTEKGLDIFTNFIKHYC